MDDWTEMVPFGPPETGEWCDTCMLPSAVKQPIVILADGGFADTLRWAIGDQFDQVLASGELVICLSCRHYVTTVHLQGSPRPVVHEGKAA